MLANKRWRVFRSVPPKYSFFARFSVRVTRTLLWVSRTRVHRLRSSEDTNADQSLDVFGGYGV